ncbi:Rne/Rng family ribonuclease [Limnoraphis robusta]|uniref:Rne/Rng family ribonuclease n=1 Tax=Limnoraphis robusta CCNP1315 TaxID=3110306 RepID=A0ABU5U2K6_9CYAN|nr:Rne/Rng family ribonuclease [Limnoraphis robusta]MEA5520348.1 Rne/Rng family ribonuclease [Limnoraphis robusta CCNP1315]MEA5548345.1 Rne/Rng family ribonuclease [Limnoraphis robusta CCNP1324]
MSKQIIIAEQHRIAAVFSEDQIQELVVATGNHQVSDIYLGVVENVLPGIDAAFVNIGDAERNGFIHVSDLGPLRLKKSSGSITELLAPQQKVLVQVMKEPTGTKGPRLTGNITLPGRYLVLMPYGRGVNLSRRIRSETERNRLKALAILIKPSGMGLLVRTEAEGMAEDAILEDLESLQKQWENVQQEGSSTRPPALLNRDNDFIQRVLRDMYSGDVNRIVVDSHSGIKRVKQHLMNWSAGKAPQGVLIDHHRERIPILEYFRVNAAIREALRPRVDLPSGGYVVIQPTEALTVIDVNSGSFTRSATSRETVLWTNCEAATEIARQLRLRNIAGVIIVDFIDMDSRRDQLQVLEHFNKVLKADKARPQIAQLSELGLVELTRKRQGQNIYELFGRPCQTCNGLGHLVHLPGESEVEPTESMTTGERVVLTPRSGLSVSSLPEITERLLPEKTIVLDAPQPREEPETVVELDSSSNLQDLELINHPSYQDISTAGNARRRRRRRIGELDSLVRDSEPSRNHLRLAPTSGYNENRPELQLSEGLPTRSTLAERSRTVKSETLKPPTEQPEVISVEMTSDEQQMYAMMGISPLLLSHQTLKNTRNVIVTVRLPGEEPPSPKDLLEESEEEPIEVPSPEPFFESTVSMDSFSIEPPEEIAVEEFSPSPSLAVAEDLEDSLDLEDDSDSSSRRRRRRRSSAVPD